MKNYKFKLDALLKLRKFNEHRGKLELAKVNQRIMDIKEEMAKTETEIDIAYDALHKMAKNEMDGQMARFFPEYIKAKRDYIAQKENELEYEIKIYEAKVTELSKLRGEVKLVDNMKERDYQKEKKKFEKKRQEDIDDIIQARRNQVAENENK